MDPNGTAFYCLFLRQQAWMDQQRSPDQPMSAEGNPVGTVQELAQKQYWPPPVYTYECSGENHPATRQFSCTARLLDWSGRGAGRNKRLAKRLAAVELVRQMLMQPDLRPPTPASAPPAPVPELPAPSEPAKATAPVSDDEFQRLRASKRLQSASRAGAEVGGMFRGLRNRKAGAVLPPIEAEPGPGSPSEQLLALGREHRFGVNFLPPLGNCGAGGPHRSVVKLSIMPTVVIVGCGGSQDDSREQACRAALEYLAVMTKENTAAVVATATTGVKK